MVPSKNRIRPAASNDLAVPSLCLLFASVPLLVSVILGLTIIILNAGSQRQWSAFLTTCFDTTHALSNLTSVSEAKYVALRGQGDSESARALFLFSENFLLIETRDRKQENRRTLLESI